MEFRFDEENGIIQDKVTGERCVLITKDRMKQIFSRFSEIFQSGAMVIITEACKVAGERYVAEVPEEKKADPEVFLKTAVQRFTDAGLGKIEVVEFNLEAAEVTFRIWNNFFAEIRDRESTYCNCIEGFVSGMYQRVILKTPKITKTKCIGKGDAYCEWHLAP